MKALPAVATRGHPRPRDGLAQSDTPHSSSEETVLARPGVEQRSVGTEHDSLACSWSDFPRQAPWPVENSQAQGRGLDYNSDSATHDLGQASSLTGPVHRVGTDSKVPSSAKSTWFSGLKPGGFFFLTLALLHSGQHTHARWQ